MCRYLGVEDAFWPKFLISAVSSCRSVASLLTSSVTAIPGHRARYGGYLTGVACPAAMVLDLDQERGTGRQPAKPA
jgi:hypothetical protein